MRCTSRVREGLSRVSPKPARIVCDISAASSVWKGACRFCAVTESASCVKTCLRQELVSSAGGCLITSDPPDQLAILWVFIGKMTAHVDRNLRSHACVQAKGKAATATTPTRRRAICALSELGTRK